MLVDISRLPADSPAGVRLAVCDGKASSKRRVYSKLDASPSFKQKLPDTSVSLFEDVHDSMAPAAYYSTAEQIPRIIGGSDDFLRSQLLYEDLA